MKTRLVEALLAIYGRAVKAGLFERPRARRAFESVYLAYKLVLEAGPIGKLQAVVPVGSTVVDVGANIGFFAVRFGHWVGPGGRVIAIEPEARNLETLRRRLTKAGLDGVVTVEQAVAADQPGELRLAVTPAHPGDHHLSAEGESVRAVTVDGVAGGATVSLVKIDVQGAEMLVLDGATQVLAESRPAIFVEVHDPSLARMGSSARELIERIVALGYRGHRLTRRGIGDPEPAEALIPAEGGYIDVLFLPVNGAATPA